MVISSILLRLKQSKPSLDWLNIVVVPLKVRVKYATGSSVKIKLKILKRLRSARKEAKRLNYTWKELIADNRLQQVTKQLESWH